MTDIRDINSTSHTSQDRSGNTIQTVRDSLPAEILLSLIIGITILSAMVVIKSYVELIDVGIYPQFVTLIVTVIHTIIRRLRIRSLLLNFILHILASVIYFFVAVNVPFLQYGNSMANMIFLAGTLIALTLFSYLYRLRPAFTASDAEFVVFPAAFHVIFYILYSISDSDEFANNLLLHAIIIAFIFIVMRQIAVFDARYYHSIHKISRPASQLKKQNLKTVAGLVGIFVVSLGVLTIFPVDLVSDAVQAVIRAIIRFIFLFLKPGETEFNLDEDAWFEMEDMGSEGQFNPLVDLAGKILAVIIIIGIICLVLNAIRILVRNAPRFSKEKEAAEDDNLIDTIEDIRPEKKQFIKSHDFGTGHERHIRKQFYDKTRRAIRKGLPVSAASTPGQIGTVLSENGDRNINSLIEEYEKVRYGKRGE
ncbi:MAG: hypothetical protein K5779_02605 [Saccharofermentans sp.]|nr:hypothetical protein [Saccharofermentans sp.]